MLDHLCVLTARQLVNAAVEMRNLRYVSTGGFPVGENFMDDVQRFLSR